MLRYLAQHSMQKYSLDVHILKVLQDSVNDPLYNQLGDTDKIVLKFSTLLHDIGKRYLVDGSDTGHAAKSAEYVYSILDRFNFEPEIKDRIISVVSNHHWFKEYCLGNTSKLDIATLCRRPQVVCGDDTESQSAGRTAAGQQSRIRTGTHGDRTTAGIIV